VGALADAQVGEYVNKHFVATFQKVGSFRVDGKQKQGGNVATYFCTPKGGIIDAVAGPVGASAMLREARWVVENRKTALLESQGDMQRYKQFFRVAHADLLPNIYGPGSLDWQHMPWYQPTEESLIALLDQNPAALQLNQEQRVHLLLAAYPLVKLQVAYKVAYESIVGEKISTRPVADRADAPAPNPNVQVKMMTAPKGWDPLTRPVRAVRNNRDTPAQPTGEQIAENARRQALLAARNKPTDTAICSAAPLNLLLEDLEMLRGDGISLQNVSLSAETLAHINLTNQPNGPTPGLLRDAGKLNWPIAWCTDPLQTPSASTRQRIDDNLTKAIAKAKDGHADGNLLLLLRSDITDLRNFLDRQISRMPSDNFIDAKRYLDELIDAVIVLGRDDAAKYLGSTFSVAPDKVKTVTDLVAFMTDNHLTFAPTVTGDERAYHDLHKALAQCDGDAEAKATPVDTGEM
jgi:hypothetical protein